MGDRERIMDRVRGAVAAAALRCDAVLPPVPGLDVRVEDDEGSVIPELGISGQFTREGNVLNVWVDAGSDRLVANLEEAVTRSFAHERMHAAREQSVPWEGGSLLDCLVAEGLAQSFELEVWPGARPAIYAAALSPEEIDEAWARAKPLLNSRDQDADSWFYGSEKDGLKKWSGYALGFWLVQNFLSQNGRSAAQMAQAPSSDFVA